MALQLTRLNVPSLTTDYSAETNAAAQLGKTLGDLIPNMQKQQLQAQKQQLLGSLTGGATTDFNKVGLGLLALGDTQGGAAILGLGQKAKEQERESEWMKNNAGIFGGGGAPVAPTALGSPNEVENRFVSTVKQAGLTNPVGLGAVAAYGNAESKYNPGNVNRTWSDPAESGAGGTSGGIMSWREDRLRNLQRFAAGKGEQGNGSPETQALFLAQEDPTLIPRLNAAKTPQEANQIMAQAWRFAGHDRPGQGEYARREGLTSQYAQRFAGQPGQRPQAPQGVQVAETEEDVQRLEGSAPQAPGSGGVYATVPTPALQAFINNPKVPDNLRGLMQQEIARRGAGGPVQMAQAPAQPGAPVADAPAAGSANAEGGFVIPGTTPQQTQVISSDPQVRQFLRALDGAPERFKAGIKQRLDLRIEELKQARTEQGVEGQLKQEQLTKARRENAGEEPLALTPEERQKFGIAPDQAAYRTRDGIKFGPAGTKIINEAQKLQGAEDKARVDINTKFIGKLADSGPQVAQRMADMDVLAAVIRDAPPGPTADVQVFFDRLGAGLGLTTGELATRSDAMKAIVQRLAPAQREEGSGSTSDIEFKGMLASFPSLATTAEGRQMILTTIARQNEITRMRIEVADQWTQGEIPATEARKKIAAIDKASIYASEDEKRLIKKLAGTEKGGDLGKDGGALRREVGGKIYEQRGGQWYPVGGN